MADEWVGTIHTTAQKYLKGAADLTRRSRLLLAMLQNRGRFVYGESGYNCIWTVEMDHQPVSQYADMQVLNFQRHDRHKQLEIDWRGYVATDTMTKMEKEKNKGETQIINRYKDIIPSLTKSLRNHFCAELYVDGYAAGNENAIHGIESFMGVGTTGAGDRIAEPSDTYGGLSTALGAEGGSWSDDLTTQPNSTVSKDWPDGNGDPRYDYLSPKLLNWSSTGWDGASTTFQLNGIRVLRQGHTWMTQTGGQEGRPDICLMNGNLLYAFKNAHQSYLQIMVPHKEAQDLGFSDALQFEGMAVDSDFDVPVNTAYFLNVDMMEVACLTDDLFWTDGPTWDPRVLAWLFSVGFMGNIRWQPKFFGKAKNYA